MKFWYHVGLFQGPGTFAHGVSESWSLWFDSRTPFWTLFGSLLQSCLMIFLRIRDSHLWQQNKKMNVNPFILAAMLNLKCIYRQMVLLEISPWNRGAGQTRFHVIFVIPESFLKAWCFQKWLEEAILEFVGLVAYIQTGGTLLSILGIDPYEFEDMNGKESIVVQVFASCLKNGCSWT